MSKSPSIPAVILPLIKTPPLLKGESSHEYYELLAQLTLEIEPNDLIEWLWVIQFLDCSWELFRIRRLRALLIDLQHGRALQNIIMKTLPYDSGPALEFDRHLKLWKDNPEFFEKFNIDPRSVEASAFMQRVGDLEKVDKLLERLERRADKLVEQLEFRREFFANKAQRAAETLLNAKTIKAPSIAQSEKPSQIGQENKPDIEQQTVDPCVVPITPSAMEEIDGAIAAELTNTASISSQKLEK